LTKPKYLFTKLCHLAGEAISEYRLIRDGDRIVVGLSWGKDSIMLMHVLQHLQRRAPVHFDLCAVWVDGGFNPGKHDEFGGVRRGAGLALPGRDGPDRAAGD